MAVLTNRPQIKIWNDVPCPVLKNKTFISPINDFQIAIDIDEGIPKNFVVRRVKIDYSRLISSEFYRTLSALATYNNPFCCSLIYGDSLQPTYKVKIVNLNGSVCHLNVLTRFFPGKKTSRYFSIIS